MNYDNEILVNDRDIQKLRDAGLVNNNEIVLKTGDLFVAENVLTKERRLLKNARSLLSEGQRLLRDQNARVRNQESFKI